jgi:hypothetical protein
VLVVEVEQHPAEIDEENEIISRRHVFDGIPMAVKTETGMNAAGCSIGL